MSSDEVVGFEALRLEGKVSAADAEIVAICQRRSWIYVTMDRVAALYAEKHSVRSVDLHALLKAALTGGLLTEDQLRALVEQMERVDHTIFPFQGSAVWRSLFHTSAGSVSARDCLGLRNGEPARTSGGACYSTACFALRIPTDRGSASSTSGSRRRGCEISWTACSTMTHRKENDHAADCASRC